MENNITCPSCKKLLSMKNIFGYDDETMKVLGIIYIIECKCGRHFVSNMRFGKKMNKGQAKKLIEELRVKIDI